MSAFFQSLPGMIDRNLQQFVGTQGNQAAHPAKHHLVCGRKSSPSNLEGRWTRIRSVHTYMSRFKHMAFSTPHPIAFHWSAQTSGIPDQEMSPIHSICWALHAIVTRHFEEQEDVALAHMVLTLSCQLVERTQNAIVASRKISSYTSITTER